MTFKIHTRWRYDPERRQEGIDRMVLVHRDADDSGYADRDVTLRQLHDHLKRLLADLPKVKP
mgnify:CR=1 FL=1